MATQKVKEHGNYKKNSKKILIVPMLIDSFNIIPAELLRKPECESNELARMM